MEVNSKKILANSLWLYARMLVVTLVSLYTSRVVLNRLGVDDFGIYNVAGGIVAFLSVLTTTMANASQRFFNLRKGEGDYDGLKKLYGISRKMHVALSMIMLFFAETIGLYLITNVMSFPADRYNAAIIVYEFSVLSLLFYFLRVPDMAVVVTYEKFSFIAWSSLFDVCFKLIMALSLAYVPFDRLIYYGASYALLALVQYILFACYSEYKLIKPEKISFRNMVRSEETRSIVNFSGWSMAGNFCDMLANQGINLIFNYFYGLVVNAAMGITNQVRNAVASVVNNVQLAFRPQLLQSYSNDDKKAFFSLLYSATKWSFFLIMLVAVPLVSNIDYVLHIWLGNVPDHAAEFIIIIIFYLVIDSVSLPVYYALEANGRIQSFQLVQSIAYVVNVLAAYLLCFLGLPSTISLATMLVTNACLYIAKLICFKVVQKEFSFYDYFRGCLIYILSISVVCCIFFFIYRNNECSFISFIKSCLSFVIIYAISIMFLGVSRTERRKIVQYAKRLLNLNKK